MRHDSEAIHSTSLIEIGTFRCNDHESEICKLVAETLGDKNQIHPKKSYFQYSGQWLI